MKHIILTYLLPLSFLAIGSEMLGQQEWAHTQHMFNLYDVNAAFAGESQHGMLGLRYRSQWTGIDGAPSTAFVSWNSKGWSETWGWGATASTESIGAHEETYVSASLAYKVRLSELTKLSFSIRGGFANQTFDLAALNSKRPDEVLSQGSINAWAPMINSAILFRTRKMYAGFEMSRLIESKWEFNEFSIAKQASHFYFITGVVIPLDHQWVLRPSALIRATEIESPQIEVQTAAFYKKKIWMGVGYRVGFGAMVFSEYYINRRFRIGYSYDFAMGTINGFGSTHELFVGWQVLKGGPKPLGVRYF